MMWEIKNKASVKAQADEAEKPANPAGNDTLDIYVYSDVDKKWWDEDDSVGANEFKELLNANPDAKNINVYINSYGGSVSEGVAIYNQLKRHKAYVTAYIDGFACSIASVIPMAADKVVMSDCGAMMIHNPWTFACGNSAEMRKCADTLDKIRDACIIPAYKAKINGKITDEKISQLLDDAQFLTPAECLEYGLVDEVANSTVDKEKAMDLYNEFVNQAKARFMNSFAGVPAPENREPVKAHEEPEPEKEPAEPENTEPEKAPEQEEPTAPAPEEKPVEDKAEAQEYFMKLLKGEI